MSDNPVLRVLLLPIFAAACQPAPAPAPALQQSEHAVALAEASAPRGAPHAATRADASAAPEAPAPAASAAAPGAGDPMANHSASVEQLRALIDVAPLSAKQKSVIRPDAFLARVLGVDGPSRISQGNRAIAQHRISKEACLAGLKDIVVQSPEQRRLCGAENMVPVWQSKVDAHGSVTAQAPNFCIDVFEFPNRACELPFVWTPPTYAKKICELEGKRLCAQPEWNLACRGDPAGGADRVYAYGDSLDLDVCHTNLAHRQACVAKTAKTAWDTCTTDTEPAGAYPQCRSRFGVFDQHGNVAEVMMRREGAEVFTQLKGSAWFYRELAREPKKPVPESTPNKAGAYPDHCNFDPRWHVEKLASAWHVNYHLGFRCCKSIP